MRKRPSDGTGARGGPMTGQPYTVRKERQRGLCGGPAAQFRRRRATPILADGDYGDLPLAAEGIDQVAPTSAPTTRQSSCPAAAMNRSMGSSTGSRLNRKVE